MNLQVRRYLTREQYLRKKANYDFNLPSPEFYSLLGENVLLEAGHHCHYDKMLRKRYWIMDPSLLYNFGL